MKNAQPKFSILLYQFPAIFWAVLTFILSSTSNLPTPDLGFSLQDKLVHFLYYTVFGFLLAMAFRQQDKYSSLKFHFILFAILVGSLYGASDELHQYFVQGRTMDFWDWVADTGGVMTGALLFKMKLILWKRHFEIKSSLKEQK